MLHIYDSVTKQKQPFQPIKPKEVNLYVCGVTVYDYCHIGHARVYVVFDMMTRFLREQGYKVNYVRNITDIDDKIIKRANENGESITALTERFTKHMHEDFAALNILPPDSEPRATEHITQIIQMIQTLIQNNYAYVGKNGDVYYRVRQFKNYGALAHKDIEDLRAGARVEIAEAKEDPLDFVLWKIGKENEPNWLSPWGQGRPGWHIECSAMSTHCLGNHFDIHGGGFDLQFPHHENEIAQAEGATQETFVNTWIHVGFVQIAKEKMSKSLGNFFTIREVLEKYHPEVVRYFLVSSHYRSPVNYSQENLELARNTLESLYIALRELPAATAPANSEFENQFNQTMNDDFNTPEALGVLFAIAREINRTRQQDIQTAAAFGALLKKLAGILGILQVSPEAFLRSGVMSKEPSIDHEKIEALVQARQLAREQKNWQEADNIRKQLADMRVVLEDTNGKTLWRIE